MNTIYDRTWPVNWMEQALFINKIQQAKQQITTRTGVTTIRSWTEPTQSDWEAAYLEESGLLPPIIPGVVLRWIQKGTNIIRQYTTAFDENGGATSSGQVYPQARLDYEGNAFKLLGIMTQDIVSLTNYRLSFISPHHKRTYELVQENDQSIHFVLPDYKTWLQRGLTGLQAIIRTRGSLAADATRSINFTLYSSGAPIVTGFDISPAGYNAYSGHISGLSTPINSAQPEFSWIYMRITNPGALWDFANQTEYPYSFNYAIAHTYMFNGPETYTATSCARVYANYPMPIGYQVERNTFQPSSTKTFEVADYNLSTKGWLYGYFNNNKQGTMEELGW